MLQLSQRPLMATAADAALFVDPAGALAKLKRSARLQLNALLLGARGSGKTSLLHRLERGLRDEGVDVRFIEASSAATLDDLVDLVHAAVHGSPRGAVDRALAALAEKGVAGDLRRLGDGTKGRHIVLLLDSVAKPKVVHEMFGQQRDELWELPFRWIVAGNEADRRSYLEPPADSFFDLVIELDELSVQDAEDLFRRRATAPGTADDPAAKVLREITTALAQRVTPRTPRQLLSAARVALLADEDPTMAVQHLYALQQLATGLGRPAAMLFTEMLNMGPVSASDGRLLDRLGWTRSRAVQVFKKLEGEGLVVANSTANGQGRPRKLYEINRHHDDGPAVPAER